jgi:acetyl-CoA C-acetyltransferase
MNVQDMSAIVRGAASVVPMIAARVLDIPTDKRAVNGGATALGHPIGASGARVIATLLGAFRARNGRREIASLCIDGGEATTMAIELTD